MDTFVGICIFVLSLFSKKQLQNIQAFKSEMLAQTEANITSCDQETESKLWEKKIVPLVHKQPC